MYSNHAWMRTTKKNIQFAIECIDAIMKQLLHWLSISFNIGHIIFVVVDDGLIVPNTSQLRSIPTIHNTTTTKRRRANGSKFDIFHLKCNEMHLARHRAPISITVCEPNLHDAKNCIRALTQLEEFQTNFVSVFVLSSHSNL